MAIKNTKKEDKKKNSAFNALSGNVIKFLYWGSIISLILILFASMQHVQTFYLSVENQGVRDSHFLAFAPWTQAIGMEVALVVAAVILALKRRKKEKAEGIYSFGIWALIFLNFCGNMYAALTAHSELEFVKQILNNDRFRFLQMLIASGTIPLFALLLLEYTSFFFVQIKTEETAMKLAQEKERKKLEREEIRETRKRLREERELRKREEKDMSIIAVVNPEKPKFNLIEPVKLEPVVEQEPVPPLLAIVEQEPVVVQKIEKKPYTGKPRGRPPKVKTEIVEKPPENLKYEKVYEPPVTTPQPLLRRRVTKSEDMIQDPDLVRLQKAGIGMDAHKFDKLIIPTEDE